MALQPVPHILLFHENKTKCTTLPNFILLFPVNSPKTGAELFSQATKGFFYPLLCLILERSVPY